MILNRSLTHIQALQVRGTENLYAMISAVDFKTDPVDRHFLLQGIVVLTYKERADPEMRSLCRKYSEMHLAEFPVLAGPLRAMIGGFLPRVLTFQSYATVLTEDGEYDKAIEVCRSAIKYGLDEVLSDGTKSGYPGRIKRIEKRMLKAGK